MSNVVIKLTPEVEIDLTSWAIATGSKECSGLGMIERNGNILTVTEVDLLGVGSFGYTEFPPERRPDKPYKLWWHKHPIGSGIPGPDNWSATDVHTATQEPLGAPPQLVQWSVAIVLTPKGWVGRVDFHVPALRTFHCAVEPNRPSPEVQAAARERITPELKAYIAELENEFQQDRYPTPQRSTIYSHYENYDEEGTGFYCPDCNYELEFADADDYGLVEYYACPNCNQAYVRMIGAVAVDETYRPRRRRAWRQSKFWRNILGR